MPEAISYVGSTPARVFVVEDEGLIAHGIAATLRRAGYEVTGIVGSGEEALLKIAELRPQLILMDIHLSGRLTGIEVADRVRELYQIPVVFLTAHSDTETLNRAKVAEPFAYLPKPVQQSNLFTAIEVALFRHRVESDVRRQRAWLNTVLGTMEDGVIVTDTAGTVHFVNAHAARLTGWSPSDAVGKPIAVVLPLTNPELELSLDNLILSAIDYGHPRPMPSNVHACDINGATFPIDCEVAPSWDNGEIAGSVITFRSATQRLLEEQELRHNHKMLAVGRLAAGVAHDFNNLLTVILGTAEMAISSLPAEHKLSSALKQIIRAGETAADITRKLLAFSSKQSSEVRVTDWNTVVRNLEGLCRHLLGPNVAWSNSLTPNPGCVRADPSALAEVLINLVTNARDAMPDGGHLTIRTSTVELDAELSLGTQKSQYVCLVVEDTGRGMDSETAEHLFEPFFTTKFPGKGTGLGLSIVDGIVRGLGGSIDVASKPGVGSTFTVYLPRVSPAPDEAAPEPNTELQDKTLLVVDDDDAVRHVLVSNLEGYGYRILEAESGAQAMQLLEDQPSPIDLLITDVLMPNISGPQLSTSLRSLYPQVKTLFVTGFSGDLLPEADLSQDGVSLLRKPFRQAQLLRQVDQLLADEEHLAR